MIKKWLQWKVENMNSYLLAKSATAVEKATLQRDKTLRPNKCPGYDIKQSDGEAPVMLEFSGMQSTSSLPSLSGPL